MKKKLLSFALCVVMACSLFTGCGPQTKMNDSETAPKMKEVFEANKEILDKIKDGALSVKASVKFAFEGESSAFASLVKSDEARAELSAKMVAELDQDTMHLSGDMQYDIFGEADKLKAEAYYENNGDIYVSEDGENWIKKTTDGFDISDLESEEDEEETKKMISDIQRAIDDNENVTFEAEDGEWVLRGEIDAKKFADSDTYEGLEGDEDITEALESIGLDKDLLERLEGTVTVIAKFDKDSLYVTYMGIEFSDKLLNSLSDVLSDYVDSLDKFEFYMDMNYEEALVEVPSNVKADAE